MECITQKIFKDIQDSLQGITYFDIDIANEYEGELPEKYLETYNTLGVDVVVFGTNSQGHFFADLIILVSDGHGNYDHELFMQIIITNKKNSSMLSSLLIEQMVERMEDEKIF